jgi:hypothetical protein
MSCWKRKKYGSFIAKPQTRLVLAAAMGVMIPHHQQVHLLELVHAPQPIMPPLEVTNPTLAHIGMVVHAHNLLPQGPAVLAQLEAMPAVIQPLQTQCAWEGCDPCSQVLIGTTDARIAQEAQPGLAVNMSLHGVAVHTLVVDMLALAQPPFARGAQVDMSLHTHSRRRRDRRRQPAESDDEGPSGELLRLLGSETAAYAKELKDTRYRTRGCNKASKAKCTLCVKRAFHRPCQLRAHVKKYHVAKSMYVQSGCRKQLRVMQAMFDNDRIARAMTQGYLSRSATLLARQVGKALCATNCGTEFDRATALVLGATGPFYVPKRTLHKADFRRVGNYYYTKDFAVRIFRDALLSDARVEQVRVRAAARAQEHGCELVSFLPRMAVAWEALLSDVFYSPHVVKLLDGYKTECEAHTEYKSISIDATVKPSFALLGQAPYVAMKAVKADQAVSVGDQRHGVLSLRGRTGAVLALAPIQSEASRNIKDAFSQVLTWSQLAQIEYIATDDPSPLLLAELKSICPRLRGISLDPLHLAINYETAHGNRMTGGSALLRKILRKVAGASGPRPVGGMFDGTSLAPLTQRERTLRRLVLTKGMGIRRARTLASGLNTGVRFHRREDFIEHIAALVALFPKDMRRRHLQRTVHALLYTACAPERVEWLFNGARTRAMFTAAERVLLPIGTTSNEALNNELKRHFLGQSMHLSTMTLKLRIFLIKKMMARTTALYHPTTVQFREFEIAHRAANAVDPWKSEASWSTWCARLRGVGDVVRKSVPALHTQRKFLSTQLASWAMKCLQDVATSLYPSTHGGDIVAHDHRHEHAALLSELTESISKSSTRPHPALVPFHLTPRRRNAAAGSGKQKGTAKKSTQGLAKRTVYTQRPWQSAMLK